MKVKVSLLDPLALCGVWILSQKGFKATIDLEHSPWWLLWALVIVGGWFFHPRWDKQNGWRFKRD